MTPENTTRTSLTSVFGRAAYDYDNRYYAEFSFRYDGSSKFRSDLRWGFFPSVSLGWRLSQEAFMESYRDNVGDLKIRGSYGTLGNQSVGDYQYFTTYNVYSNTYAFNNVGVGGAGFQLGTDNLQWEVSKTFNVGFDASFFRGKLNLGFDYFNKHTTDILVKPQTPLILGTELQNYNAGEMRTQGWELTLSYALKKRDWSHFFQFNIGDSWNKVLKYEGFEDISGQEEFWRITREGLPFNSYYGYKTDGFFQSYDEIAHSAVPTGKSVKPGDVKFKDRNGDGTIDENDRYYLGNAFPRYTLGFTYNVAWKGIDLSIFLQGVLKRDMMVRGELIEPFHSNYGYTMYEHQLDFWTPDQHRRPLAASDRYLGPLEPEQLPHGFGPLHVRRQLPAPEEHPAGLYASRTDFDEIRRQAFQDLLQRPEPAYVQQLFVHRPRIFGVRLEHEFGRRQLRPQLPEPALLRRRSEHHILNKGENYENDDFKIYHRDVRRRSDAARRLQRSGSGAYQQVYRQGFLDFARTCEPWCSTWPTTRCLATTRSGRTKP